MTASKPLAHRFTLIPASAMCWHCPWTREAPGTTGADLAALVGEMRGHSDDEGHMTLLTTTQELTISPREAA